MSKRCYKKYGSFLCKLPEDYVKDYINYNFHNREKKLALSLEKVIRLERFCGFRSEETAKAKKERIIAEYGLVYSRRLNSYDAVDRDATFGVFQQKFEVARKYKSMNEMLYAMMYGEVPTKVYKISEVENHDRRAVKSGA